MSVAELQPLRKNDLQIGIPLPYPVYDGKRQLLLRAGQVIQNEKQLETLIAIGLFANPQWHRSKVGRATGGARVYDEVDASSASNATPEPVRDNAAPAPGTSRSLAQLKLQPGTLMHLQNAGDALKPKAAVKLIGWLDKASVLVSATGAQGSILPFREGESLQVKTMAGKDIVAFVATVQKLAFTPYPLLFLSWPEQLQIHQLRRSLRVNTRLIASVSNTTQSQPLTYSARLCNLSAGGAMLECDDILGLRGDELQIALRLINSGEARTLTLRALVRNVHPAGHDGNDVMQWGLEFIETDPDTRLVLEHYIYQTLLEQ